MAELRRITLAPDRRAGDCFRLTDEARHYLCRVLRLATGNRCIVADGCGGVWEVALVECDGELLAEIVAELAAARPTELPIPLVLVAAVPKGNGFDEVVRQVTELGATTIVPVTSDRTVLKPNPKRVERWRRIAMEAFEQCERAIVPQVLAPQPFVTWLQTLDIGLDSGASPEADAIAAPTFLKTIAIARDDALPLQESIGDGIRTNRATGIAIAIGPEGGWTPRERDAAIAAGFVGVSLGGRVLRAVTASVAAVAIASMAIEARR